MEPLTWDTITPDNCIEYSNHQLEERYRKFKELSDEKMNEFKSKIIRFLSNGAKRIPMTGIEMAMIDSVIEHLQKLGWKCNLQNVPDGYVVKNQPEIEYYLLLEKKQ